MSRIGFEPRSQAQTAGASVSVPRVRPLIWGVLACVFLGGSGLVRTWQDRRLDVVARLNEPAPFALKDLPKDLAGWHYLEGGDQRLDPEIAKIAGSTDHLIRTYVDESTGVNVTVLVVYGNGQTLSAHTPEVCYPNVGYTASEEPSDRASAVAPPSVASFRSLAFSKRGGTDASREEVYYSFRHEGRWYPNAAIDWKRFRYNPAMFKVQIQRRLAPQERRYLNNPTEQFLNVFMPLFEKQITDTEAKRNPAK
jgi:hypothetical protein